MKRTTGSPEDVKGTTRIQAARSAFSRGLRIATSPRIQRVMDALHASRWLVVTAISAVSLLVVAVPETGPFQEELVILLVAVALIIMGYKPQEALDKAVNEMSEDELRDAINKRVYELLDDMAEEQAQQAPGEANTLQNENAEVIVENAVEDVVDELK